MVFLTATGIALIAHYLIPGMTWPLSFVLGAILSATDAVAAMGITKGLGLLDLKSCLIISWSGMRGIVSLAIAIGLPATLADGRPFPQRNAIIFLSVVVVLFTLIGQGLTLPWLVRWLNKR